MQAKLGKGKEQPPGGFSRWIRDHLCKGLCKHISPEESQGLRDVGHRLQRGREYPFPRESTWELLWRMVVGEREASRVERERNWNACPLL